MALRWQTVGDVAAFVRGSIGTSALRLPRGWDLAGLVGGKVIFVSWVIVAPLLVYPWWAVARRLSRLLDGRQPDHGRDLPARALRRGGRLRVGRAARRREAALGRARGRDDGRLLPAQPGSQLGGRGPQLPDRAPPLPRVPHTHYAHIATIVQRNAEQHGVRYVTSARCARPSGRTSGTCARWAAWASRSRSRWAEPSGAGRPATKLVWCGGSDWLPRPHRTPRPRSEPRRSAPTRRCSLSTALAERVNGTRRRTSRSAYRSRRGRARGTTCCLPRWGRLESQAFSVTGAGAGAGPRRRTTAARAPTTSSSDPARITSLRPLTNAVFAGSTRSG